VPCFPDCFGLLWSSVRWKPRPPAHLVSAFRCYCPWRAVEGVAAVIPATWMRPCGTLSICMRIGIRCTKLAHPGDDRIDHDSASTWRLLKTCLKQFVSNAEAAAAPRMIRATMRVSPPNCRSRLQPVPTPFARRSPEHPPARSSHRQRAREPTAIRYRAAPPPQAAAARDRH
jgi:hypothetical protein